MINSKCSNSIESVDTLDKNISLLDIDEQYELMGFLNRFEQESVLDIEKVNKFIEAYTKIKTIKKCERELEKYSSQLSELPNELYMGCKDETIESTNVSDDYGESLAVKTNTDEKQQMLSKIHSSYFEAGVFSEADKYFDELVEKYHSIAKPLKLLSSIANHNLDQEHVLEGVLHILSNRDYTEIDPIGITIVLMCTVNHFPVIQDKLISCFEDWDSEEGIDILEKLKIEIPWIARYRDDVVAKLKKKKQSA